MTTSAGSVPAPAPTSSCSTLPSPAHLVYRPGVPLIARTIVGGETVWATA